MMNVLGQSNEIQRELCRLLGTARGRVHRAFLRSAICVAGERAMLTLMGLAAAHALVRLTLPLIRASSPIGWSAYGWMLLLGLLTALGVTIIPVLTRRPTLLQAAERLDLSTGNHNRVAAALEFVGRDRKDAFTSAAIQDGLASARGLKDALPFASPVPPRWRRLASMAAAFVVLNLLAGLSVASNRQGPAQYGLSPVLHTPDRELTPAGEVAEGRVRPDQPLVRPAERGVPGAPFAAPDSAAAPVGTAKGVEPRAASGTRGGSVKTDRSERMATPGDQSSEAGLASTGQQRVSRQPFRPQPRQASHPGSSGRPEGQPQTSAVSQGTSGGGSMSAAQHHWAQREMTADSDLEEETDEEVEDERRESFQRGGVQPSLKDRQEAPSRELGISGDQGVGGTGRGGPSPPKKARGTASLVLGVPIPDFVKGRMGPGTTKVVQERVAPSAMPGEPTESVGVAERAVPEAPNRRFEVPLQFATVVRDYLVTLASAMERENLADAGATATAPEAAEE